MRAADGCARTASVSRQQPMCGRAPPALTAAESLVQLLSSHEQHVQQLSRLPTLCATAERLRTAEAAAAAIRRLLHDHSADNDCRFAQLRGLPWFVGSCPAPTACSHTSNMERRCQQPSEINCAPLDAESADSGRGFFRIGFPALPSAPPDPVPLPLSSLSPAACAVPSLCLQPCRALIGA